MLLSTRDTVLTETPANFATSLIVIMRLTVLILLCFVEKTLPVSLPVL
jgi:hypothetical protein